MEKSMNIKHFIDVNVLQKIQDQFSIATGLAAISVDKKGKPVTTSSNFSEFCTVMRSQSSTKKACQDCDAHGGLKSASIGSPYFYKCHSGLIDIAVPIMVSDNYLGAVLAGQIKLMNSSDEKIPSISNIDINYKQDEKLKKLYDKIPSISFEKINAAAQMMYAVTNHIVEKQYMNYIQEKFNNNNLKLLESITIRTDLERALKEAELRALQSQINPHFLFNVLNTIGRLALIENANKTENMIYYFSDMMRYTLKKNSQHSVTLKDEISHVNNYLSIQKFRLGNRLNYDIKIPERYYNIECPFMTIQPLVENSIKYVVEKKIEGGNITIEAFEKDDNLVLSVKDDGDWLSKDEINRALNGDIYNKEDNSGIGLYNVHKRLIYSYGTDYGLKIKSLKGKGTTVLITLSKKSNRLMIGDNNE